MKRYDLLSVDPPWEFEVWSDKGDERSASSLYPVLDLDELKALPMQNIMKPDCVVCMWAITPMLPQAWELGTTWGLTYKTLAFAWIKRTVTGEHWHMGMGYWTRANVELCFLFTQGNPKRDDKGVRQLIAEARDLGQMDLFPPIIERVGAHSVKPDESYRRMERLVDGDYVDVFARQKRAGWDAIGNEIDGQDIRDVLKGRKMKIGRIQIDPNVGDAAHDRIDLLVWQRNEFNSYGFRVIKGTPALNPQPPVLSEYKSFGIWHKAVAEVHVEFGAVEINAIDISIIDYDEYERFLRDG